MIWPDTKGKSTSLTLYDTATDKSTPLINAVSGYQIQLEKVEGNLLTLAVIPVGQTFDSYKHLARYTIRLP